MRNLNILYLNVRGLNNSRKRNSIFKYLQDQKCDIFLLQETYSQGEDEKLWASEWGDSIYFSHGSSHSRGTCILLNPKLDATVLNSFRDSFGRVLLLNLNINNEKMSIVNIYAPTEKAHQIEFLQELTTTLNNKTFSDSLIIGGDWNVTLNKIDKQGGRKWTPSPYGTQLKTVMGELDLSDIFRDLHPKKGVFTYESKHHNCRLSRLDFFLISRKFKQSVLKTSTRMSIARGDHKAVFISLRIEKTKRGPGFSKFNNTLLKDQVFSTLFKTEYQNIRTKYEGIASKKLR